MVVSDAVFHVRAADDAAPYRLPSLPRGELLLHSSPTAVNAGRDAPPLADLGNVKAIANSGRFRREDGTLTRRGKITLLVLLLSLLLHPWSHKLLLLLLAWLPLLLLSRYALTLLLLELQLLLMLLQNGRVGLWLAWPHHL